jgi:hypothetical protein
VKTVSAHARRQHGVWVRLDRLQIVSWAPQGGRPPLLKGYKVVRDWFVRCQTTISTYARVRQYQSVTDDTKIFWQYQRLKGWAKTSSEKKTALRVLHAIRKEMAAVVKQDFGAVRVQYQGDRVQAMVHLPQDDGESILARAVEMAAGLQSSMEYTLKANLPEAASLAFAIGIDYGVTLASNLGVRGDRDHICIGLAVERAARGQEACRGTETALTPSAFAILPSELQSQFAEDKNRKLFVATSSTSEKLERVAKAATYGTGGVFLRATAGATTVSSKASSNARAVLPSKSWAE